MRTTQSRLLTAAAVLAALVPAIAQTQKPDEPAEMSRKDATYARLVELAREIEANRAQGWNQYQLAPLLQEYETLSASLGGDDPGAVLSSGRLSQARASRTTTQQALAVPPACGVATVSASFAGTTGPLGTGPANGGGVFTVVVSTPDTFLWDLNLNTTITHTECQDLDITLTSPAGTVVTISTDNGGTLDNLFNGTLWDDNVNDPVTDKTFTNNVVATPLSPEGRLAAFRGENPNGTWTLAIVDDLNTDVGNLTAWSLDVTTLSSAPAPTTTNFTRSPALAIVDNATVSDSVVVSGLGTYLLGGTLYIEAPHTFASDLDITLTSAAGTVVKVTTDNGGGNDNVFNGTLFDPDAPNTVTDYVFTNNVVAVTLSPEGSFDNFLGQDPNGTWTLSVADDAGGDTGTLVRWDLNLTTIAAPSPSAPANVAGTGGALPDATVAVTSGTFTFTASVAGMPSSLWDVDLSTAITHTFNSDLDITLTSPGGTSVVVTTDNGGGNDNVYNGTLWDDNVNFPAVDYVYANNVTATPLSPEGRLAAFRGENPNGTWTLTVVDDLGGDLGTMNSWSLTLASLLNAPGQASTTFSQSPNLPISATGTSSNPDTIAVAGLGTSVTEVEVYLEVLHTNAADLDITLTSPAGTVVQLTTDNGGTNDNVFNGTLFDADDLVPVTDKLFTNNVTATVLSPEGSVDNFVGENPNGNWTLTVADDLTANGGTFVRWDLTVRTCSAAPPVAFCFGDGSGTACPCGNNGAAGNGCANSVNANGANLTTSGTASVSADTLVLLGTGMPSSSVLYFQGVNAVNGGLGSAFGDGLRCAGGATIRLGKKNNVGGASQYPDVGEQLISVKGVVAAGNIRRYQAWYRNAAAFCNPETYNLTNGIEVTWGP